jgi:hypothetical protein
VIEPENPPPVAVEKEPVMPVMSSMAGFPVVVKLIVPELVMPLPLMAKDSTIVPALACGVKGDATATNIISRVDGHPL